MIDYEGIWRKFERGGEIGFLLYTHPLILHTSFTYLSMMGQHYK